MSSIDENDRREFVAGFIEATLWANAYGDTPSGEPPCEADEARLSPEDEAKLVTFAGYFLREHAEDLKAAAALTAPRENGMTYTLDGSADWESLGADLALTGAGHGSGYWDRGYGAVGDRLSDAARSAGYFTVYVSEDGSLNVQEG